MLHPPAPIPVGPIATVHLFADLHADLVALLRSLSPAQWQIPTVCAGWNVQDVVAHLLGSDLSKVAGLRDGHRGPPPPFPLDTPAALLAFIDQRNAEFVSALRRASPRILLAWVEEIGRELPALFARLDPDAPSSVPVSWAGESVSATWFDLAREFTERWHHQQHIRDAVGMPDLNPRYLAPVLDTFLRALPHAYHDIAGEVGQWVVVEITGAAGGVWSLNHTGPGWTLHRGAPPSPTAVVTLDQDTAWRLFTKGLTPAQARPAIHLRGAPHLGAGIYRVVAIVA